MGSIPKIVLTPVKWVSKKIVHKALLRFPSGDKHDPIACAYCPEMCRFSCPTAVASGNDAVTPCNKNSLLYKEEKWPGQASQGGPLWTIYDCTGCGRCTNYCVYEMPVAKMLFEARSKYPWEAAKAAATGVSDDEDALGDLAHELGDEAGARRRYDGYMKGKGVAAVWEPRELSFIADMGGAGALAWETDARAEIGASLREKLSGKRWLLHESPWLARHLGRAFEIANWVERARKAGLKIEVPYHHGKDCIDCGGEGAYHRLFAEQAATMARDFWERDRDQADGILCVSARCAEHFRKVLGPSVPVVSLVEEWSVEESKE